MFFSWSWHDFALCYDPLIKMMISCHQNLLREAMGSMDSETLEALMAHKEETRQHREVMRWTGHWHGDNEDDDHDEEMVVVTGYADNDRDCETVEALKGHKEKTWQHKVICGALG